MMSVIFDMENSTENDGESPLSNEITAIIEQDNGWYIAQCPQIPGANGQGRTKKEAVISLSEAVALILRDRWEDELK